MDKTTLTRYSVTGFLQLALVAVSVIVGFYFTRDFNIVPKAVLRLPEVYVSQSDMWDTVRIFLIAFGLQIILTSWKYRSPFTDSPSRFASEYVWYLVAYTTASLYLFLATTINYDAQFVAAIGLFSTILYLLFFTIYLAVNKKSGFISSFVETISSMIKRLFSWSGAFALIYFLLPLAMGKAFSSDRDIANQITQVRIWFNPVKDSEWGFRNFLPGNVFEQPVLVRQAPNDSESVYVLERIGRVIKVNLNDKTQREVVLDISDQLGEVEVENGAIGLTFHPQFNQPGQEFQYAYLYYTDTRPEDGQINRISRFDFSFNDAQMRKDSEQIILALTRTDDGFHNGGSVEFGNDGFLYIGLGEGVHQKEFTSSADVFRAGILRIDVNLGNSNSIEPNAFKHGIAQNYRVPNDNPFIGNIAIRNEYWALGLRNPFRFSIDPSNGDIWLGDVGSTIWEEINLIEKGKHYQFPEIEGNQASGRKGYETLDIPQQGPIFTYEHNAYDRAVIGGVVYRGDKYPSLSGKYVFADNYSAKVFVMDASKQPVESVQLIARANQYAQRGVSSVVQLDSGEILVTTLGAASEASGEVLELVKAKDANVVIEEPKEDNVPKDYNDEAMASLFAVNCSRCHGATGDGKGPDSSLMNVPLPDLTSPVFHASRSNEQLKDIIALGGVQTGKSPMMPPWGGFLKPHEIDHLVIYIRSLPDKHHRH